MPVRAHFARLAIAGDSGGGCVEEAGRLEGSRAQRPTQAKLRRQATPLLQTQGTTTTLAPVPPTLCVFVWSADAWPLRVASFVTLFHYPCVWRQFRRKQWRRLRCSSRAPRASAARCVLQACGAHFCARARGSMRMCAVVDGCAFFGTGWDVDDVLASSLGNTRAPSVPGRWHLRRSRFRGGWRKHAAKADKIVPRIRRPDALLWLERLTATWSYVDRPSHANQAAARTQRRTATRATKDLDSRGYVTYTFDVADAAEEGEVRRLPTRRSSRGSCGVV